MGVCSNLSPRENWIERCPGGRVPPDICSVADHMVANGVTRRDIAIPAGVNFAEFVCTTGKSKNFLKGNPTHTVAPQKRARWCKAWGEWKTLVARCGGGGKALRTLEVMAYDLNTVPFDAGTYLDQKGVTEEDDGTLVIRGLASDWGIDRDDEAFEPGAFDRGLKSYLETNPVLLYHHNPAWAVGQVTRAERSETGLTIEGRVRRPAESDGQRMSIYNDVKAGVIRGLSVGGRFKRRQTPAGPRIYDVDLQEISVTPLPVNPSTMFEVATKAIALPNEDFDMDPGLPDDPHYDAYARLAGVLDDLEMQLRGGRA